MGWFSINIAKEGRHVIILKKRWSLKYVRRLSCSHWVRMCGSKTTRMWGIFDNTPALSFKHWRWQSLNEPIRPDTLLVEEVNNWWVMHTAAWREIQDYDDELWNSDEVWQVKGVRVQTLQFLNLDRLLQQTLDDLSLLLVAYMSCWSVF